MSTAAQFSKAEINTVRNRRSPWTDPGKCSCCYVTIIPGKALAVRTEEVLPLAGCVTLGTSSRPSLLIWKVKVLKVSTGVDGLF